jgi:hypothetical protein
MQSVIPLRSDHTTAEIIDLALDGASIIRAD